VYLTLDKLGVRGRGAGVRSHACMLLRVAAAPHVTLLQVQQSLWLSGVFIVVGVMRQMHLLPCTFEPVLATSLLRSARDQPCVHC
jgi:hypothetical protein